MKPKELRKLIRENSAVTNYWTDNVFTVVELNFRGTPEFPILHRVIGMGVSKRNARDVRDDVMGYNIALGRAAANIARQVIAVTGTLA